MATRKPKRARPARKKARPTVQQLERKVARLLAERETERAKHARQLLALRRGRDRRLTIMLREITTLRHHEARALALERMLKERDEALAKSRYDAT
jgi:hypothetical protein